MEATRLRKQDRSTNRSYCAFVDFQHMVPLNGPIYSIKFAYGHLNVLVIMQLNLVVKTVSVHLLRKTHPVCVKSNFLLPSHQAM